MLLRTSNLLAHLTSYASVVVGPKTEAATVRSIQLVGLSSQYATVVVVLGNGTVENQVVDLPADTTDETLNVASAHLARALVGSTMASAEIGPSGDPEVDAVCASAFEAIREVSSDDHVYVGGASWMAGAFDAVEVVRDVLHTLEQQFIVVSLVRDIVDRGMSVAIGIEHGVEPLSACSVVVAPVVVGGEHLGSVGVLGPTRMNYPQALATVDVVSQRLGHRLEEG
jgi:heat-inducible transcriptional repressor